MSDMQQELHSDDSLIAQIRERIAGKEVPPPASAEQLGRAESILGVRFPALLRRLLTEVANGGFGPGHGILGVEGITETSITMRFDPNDPDVPDDVDSVPQGVVWLYDWGDAMFSLLDCRIEPGLMLDYNEGELRSPGLSLAQWFQSWLDGRIY